ncbi:MAG: hypothetical protein JWQ44_859 [Chthoniobacter sp.]|nr:hypothetical protein [Chthoniobacter sp.]
MVTHLFTTPIAHTTIAVPPADAEAACAYLLAQRKREEGESRSNRGGWHSKGNLFADENAPVGWLREAIVGAILEYAGAGLGLAGEFQFQLIGWAVINRAGDYNVPHNHSPNLISGACYLRVPQGMTGGEIVFLDPRLNLNASVPQALHERRQLPPWHQTSVPHVPALGDLLVFPSWLIHYVNAFTAPDPAEVRIVISFNATV